MITLTKASPLIVAATMMLAACASSSSSLYIDPADATGKPQPGFAFGETPTFYYDLNNGPSGAGIKVHRQSDGVTVRSEYVPADFISDGTTPLDLNRPLSSAPVQKIELPGLGPGNYTLELWIKGRLEKTLNFSVSGRVDSTDRSVSHRRIHHRRIMRVRQGHGAAAGSPLSKNVIDQLVDQLDAFVGLTDQQKSEVRKIYLDDDAARLTALPNEDELPPPIAFRETKARIRALLNPGQQKLYDDDGSDWTRHLSAEKLDQLVGLTPEQKEEAEKIFDDETLAMVKFTSIKDWAEKGADIRQKTHVQIRALLTPAQQKIYDETPQRLGGGAIRTPTAY